LKAPDTEKKVLLSPNVEKLAPNAIKNKIFDLFSELRMFKPKTSITGRLENSSGG
jgi:hypothetical protein